MLCCDLFKLDSKKTKTKKKNNNNNNNNKSLFQLTGLLCNLTFSIIGAKNKLSKRTKRGLWSYG